MNFNEALNTQTGDIKKPPLQPAGTYRWVVSKVPGIDSSKDGKFDFLDFNLKCIGAGEDVDPTALEAFGSLEKTFQRLRFIFDKQDQQAFDRTLYRVRRFLEDHLQIDGAASMTLKEGLAKSVNHQCLGTIKWSQDQNDPEVQYANLDRTAPIT